MFSNSEIERYKRHLTLDQIGKEGQMKLKSARVLVVGAGGLGCPALQYLASSGLGTLGIIDGDIVELSNLHRQILYNANDIGKNKSKTAKEKLELLNPEINVQAYPFNLEKKNALKVFSDYDMVLDGTDNFATRYLINDTSLELGIPMIYGAIYKFEGQVSVFNYQEGPSYRCLFPESDNVAPNCADVGVLGILPGIIGLYQANEVLKICLGIGDVLSGLLLQLNLLNHNSSMISIKSNRKIEQVINTHE